MHRRFLSLGRAGVLVLTLACLLLSAPAAPLAAGALPRNSADAVELVPGSKLTFQSFRDNNWEVYSANDDGSGQTRLTTHNAPDIDPRFNRGATRIAFASRRDASNYNLFTMNADGSNVQQLTSGASDNTMPTWSPDGTRIAFASNRGGPFDIFVMNADGSGVTRLTLDPAQDISPTWSLDGGQIAFVSRRTLDYQVWKMNADGSGQVQLSTQPNSQNPAWSPDGSKIAFDADADGDGWKELWVMNSDGSGQQLLYDPGVDSEARAGSWSPDGRYIAFTYVHWVLELGTWVWDVANLQAWDTQNPGTIVPLVTSSGVDWLPDWQTVDIQPPTSSVQALVSLSPAPFTVNWSGYDTGPAGLCAYDVQVKDSAAGVWTDWQVQTTATTATFPGVGGHTYYFRGRARDCAYNYEAWPADDLNGDTHTLVEGSPPETAVDALPDHYRGIQVGVTWGGFDPGRSGIASYDVQYKDDGGAWTTWFTQTASTSATFTGASGHTYFFRCRARDNAHNLEAWPAGDGDTAVTFYSWAVSGIARDNRETLIAGVSANTVPAAFQTLPSDLQGNYASYVATGGSTFPVDWAATNYTPLPATTLDGSQDASFDVVMPPADNVVLNWGFEAGLTGWLTGGATLPGITETLRHTGDASALLGCQQGAFVEPWNVSNLAGTSSGPAVVADSSGDLHAAWYQTGGGINGEIYYARRPAGGSWLPPENLSNSPALASAPQIAVDASGVVHVVWAEDTGATPEIYYARRQGGVWLAPVNISQNAGASQDPQLAVEAGGIVHVIWRDNSGTPGALNVYYAQRVVAWSSPVRVSDSASDVDSLRIAVQSNGVAHALWSAGEVYYARRDAGWSTPVAISASSGTAASPRLALSGTVVHAIWVESHAGTAGVYYARNDGVWSTPLSFFSSASALQEPQLAAEATGDVHAVWRAGSGAAAEIYYARRSAGVWSAGQNLSNTPGESVQPQLALDSANTLHVVWADSSPGNREVYYRSGNNGVWSAAKNASRNSGRSDQPRMFVEGSKTVHLVWADATWGADVVLYTQAAYNELAGDSRIAQQVTLPGALNAPTLSFFYLLDGASPTTGSSLSVLVVTGSGSTTLFSTNGSANSWTHRWFDLGTWAGQTITITLNVHQAANRLCTWGYLDEVTIGGAYPDLWVEKEGPAAALPGSTVVYTIHYGNRGGAPASAVQVTDVLPAELTYVAASPPPAGTSPLQWNIGTLPAGSGPYTIVLTATVNLSAVPWSTVSNTVSIATTSPELETSNNLAAASTWVGMRVYLPLVPRSYMP